MRLARRGRSITIGCDVPDDTQVLVAMLEEVVSYDGRLEPDAMRALVAAVHGVPSVVVVRADLPLAVAAPSFATTEVMPNRATIVDPDRQRWLALLPQRGLVPRARHRRSSVHTLTCKGFDFNLPPELRDGSLADALRPVRRADPTRLRSGDLARLPSRRRRVVHTAPQRRLGRPASSAQAGHEARQRVGRRCDPAGRAAGRVPRAGGTGRGHAGGRERRPDRRFGAAAHRPTASSSGVCRRRGATRAAEFSADRVLDAWEQLFDDSSA